MNADLSLTRLAEVATAHDDHARDRDHERHCVPPADGAQARVAHRDPRIFRDSSDRGMGRGGGRHRDGEHRASTPCCADHGTGVVSRVDL
jgi:hypothetical protein